MATGLLPLLVVYVPTDVLVGSGCPVELPHGILFEFLDVSMVTHENNWSPVYSLSMNKQLCTAR